MKPLQAIAMGIVVATLYANFGPYDLLPDPVGFALVMYGITQLPRDFEMRSTLLVLAGAALLVAVPLWVPGVTDAVEDADEALGWAANLPRFGCFLLLSLVLYRAAMAAGEKSAAAWWSTMVLALAVVIALPVLYFGAGMTGLGWLATNLAVLVPVVLVVLLFTYAGRSWAGAPPTPTPTTR